VTPSSGEAAAGESPAPPLQRTTRLTRWLHAAVYLTTIAAGVTGVALWGEGVRALEPLLGGHVSAARLHRWLGYLVPVAPALALVLRPRAVGRFLRECARLHREDLAWWRRLPAFLVAPARRPPAYHRGHFDPGQRLMAWALVVTLAVLTASGLAMIFAVDALGPRYGTVLILHSVASVALAVLVVAHAAVSVGLPKGYRGVWRAMHPPGRGRVPPAVARRLWPAWVAARERDGSPER
jgi:formate dehydrogenase subunit gamma